MATCDGEPTLLLGGAVEDDLFQLPDFGGHLDDLVTVGGNYVLANLGEEYAVYLPRGGTATLEADFTGLERRWFDADAGGWATTESADEGRLNAPGDGQWVAVVQ